VGTGVEIRVLGPVSIRRDGAEIELPRSRKVRALLAFLALGRPVARSRLCDLRAAPFP
jgi:DNA-binding SARP family transcriptional activator